MSLASFAIRIATIRVLRGATYAGSRVYDSMIAPADLLKDDAEPFIVVAVDGAEKTVQGRDLLAADRTIELTLDMAVGSRVRVEKPGPDGDEGEPPEYISIPHTDSGMEITLDFMMRQVERALVSSASPWAAVWRTLVPKIVKVQSDRGASAEKGVRFATRQSVLSLQTMAEPSFGEPEGVWADLLALMRADAELKDLAEVFEQEIRSPDLEQWQRGMSDLGLNSAITFGGEPLLDPPSQPITEVAVQLGDVTLTIDEATADDALGPEPT